MGSARMHIWYLFEDFRQDRLRLSGCGGELYLLRRRAAVISLAGAFFVVFSGAAADGSACT